MALRRYRLTSSQIILYGFLLVVLLGGLLLSLPVASASGRWTSPVDALFTAVSATCVTGLIVHDTATYWSLFGQVVILALIQIGGLGVVMVAFLVQFVSGSKISLIQRTLLQDSIAGDSVAGIIRMSLFIVRTIIVVELAGAAAFYLVFCRDFGPRMGLWYAVFHAISAFCNAGFDLMGVRAQYSSLTGYSTNVIVNLTVMALIIVGGLGFYTWRDIAEHGLHFRQYRLQSKISLTMTCTLVLVPAALFAIFEYASCQPGQRVLASFFQSVTARTAGFNTMDLTKLTDNGVLVMVFLMMIGGCSGSTAGGMKTTTFAVLLASSISIFRRRKDPVLFQRRISHQTVHRAMAILTLYVAGCLLSAMVISAVEGRPVLYCIFETASAIATVGLTMGLTPTFGVVSKLILMLLMFMGRVGGLTFLFATVPGSRVESAQFPAEDVNVG